MQTKLKPHSKNAEEFIKNSGKAEWFNKSIWYQRDKRDVQAKSLPEWEHLREIASQIKSHTLSKLDIYLEEFERNAQTKGIFIHWAENAQHHNDITVEILRKHKTKRLVKSKSMLTEECDLNPFLEQNNIEVIDTDLGERIIQLAGEKPSHIVMPAIHKNRVEVGELFLDKLKTKPSSDPVYLTAEARKHLRELFLSADAALSGVNFAVAETGTVVVCTNEGNADLGINASAKVHIASMGIEKIIPKVEHLGIFTRMLARNATGQPITTYTTHFGKPENGKELHIIIVDNGRTKILKEQHFFEALKCIRCAACMNTCPVFRNSGGHSYNFVIPGPIGSVLAPNYDAKKYKDMPFACSLCGSCSNVCPVKIPLDKQLYRWRQVLTQRGHSPLIKSMIMKIAGVVLGSSFLYSIAGWNANFFIKYFRKLVTKATPWGKARELPDVPKETFKQWYKSKGKNIE